jgi:hypothetical protein
LLHVTGNQMRDLVRMSGDHEMRGTVNRRERRSTDAFAEKRIRPLYGWMT